MSSLYRLTLLYILFLGASSVHAQDTMYRFGSAYGSFALGNLSDFRGSGSEAMGLKGVAMASPVDATQANPAFWGLNSTSTGSSGAKFANTRYQDNTGSSYGNEFTMNQIQLVFPLVKTKIGMSLSLIPLTQRSFQNQATDQAAANQPNLRYDSEISGSGGINKIEGGVGFRVTPNIYMGVATSMVFGSLKTRERLTFTTSTVNPAQYEFIDNYLGWGNRIGFLARTNGFGKDKMRRIQFGGSVELPVNMRVNRQVENYFIQVLSNGVIEQRKVSRLPDESVTLPLVFTAGVTVFVNRKLTLATELDYQQWSQFNHFKTESDISYQDRVRLGTGLEFTPGNRFVGPFFSRLTYRTGFSVENGFFSILGQNVSSYSGSAGVSFPSPTSGSSIDLNFVYTNRGTTSTNLINENSLMVRLSFNLSELMFIKRLIQ